MRLWLSRKKNLLDSCCHVTLEMCWRRKLGPHTTTTTPSSTLPSLLGYSRFFVQCCCFLMIETLTFLDVCFFLFLMLDICLTVLELRYIDLLDFWKLSIYGQHHQPFASRLWSADEIIIGKAWELLFVGVLCFPPWKKHTQLMWY